MNGLTRFPLSPSNSPLATQAQSIDTAYRCQHCAYSTSTKTGLSLHVKAKHPVDFNQERLVQHELNKKNTVWSEDALRVMASTEVELKYLGGSIHINIEIEKKLTAAGWKHGFASKEKKQETIRKKRQSEAYKSMLAEEKLKFLENTSAEEHTQTANPSVFSVSSGQSSGEGIRIVQSETYCSLKEYLVTCLARMEQDESHALLSGFILNEDLNATYEYLKVQRFKALKRVKRVLNHLHRTRRSMFRHQVR